METFDVIQVGYGPVGQAMAALLGRRGPQVVVFDRQARRYGLPRVGGVDHEIMRILLTWSGPAILPMSACWPYP